MLQMWIGGSLHQNFQKPETLENKFHCDTEQHINIAYRLKKIDKASGNSTEQNKSHNIYACIARTYPNQNIPRRYFGDSSQLTNFILDSSATCHMTPEISYFIP